MGTQCDFQRLEASMEQPKQTAALHYLSLKTAVCYCYSKKASNCQNSQCGADEHNTTHSVFILFSAAHVVLENQLTVT